MVSKSEIQRHHSRLWYLLPIFLSIIGGLVAYFLVRSSDPTIAKNSLFIGIIITVVSCAIAVAVYVAYVNDMNVVRERISTSKTIDTPMGRIEYADVGQGIPILSIHGAGGGFDQGLITAETFFDEETLQSHRVISPSRFGYLQTPLPAGDAGPAAQADAHAALLDALGIDDKVIVLGTSAGALSAQEFAIKYPDRVSALILAVPAVWSPESAVEGSAEIGSDNFIANTVMRSDFAMWLFTKVAYSQLLTYVGVPENLQETMTAQEKDDAKELMDAILPVSQKVDGGRQEAINMATKERLALESIRAPTLVIDAKDVVTYPGSKYAAEHIANATLVAFETGGHLLIGHGEEARAAVQDFLKQREVLTQ
jgi:pimeloyl-ACP methyl ester carboxylesterase